MIIHLVGAQHTNYPWGFENRLISAIHEMGHTLISTDFRQERARLSELLQQKADLILICKGEGIDSHLIESCPCVTVLWYAEQIGTLEHHDETALARRRELAFNLHAFDYAFSHDPANLLVYKSLGGEKSFPLPCAAVDPAINRKADIPKKYDVTFIGSKTTRRQNLLTSLSQRGIEIYSPNIWNADELNRLFNESRVILNLHLSDLLNTETRVAEVLGSGSFLLSETLSDPGLVENGKHFVECTPGNTEELADKIKYYLDNEAERETIARQGCEFMQKNHTYTQRIQKIIDTVDFSVNRRIWPAYSIGVPINTKLKPTLRMDRYYAQVVECLKAELTLADNFVFLKRLHDSKPAQKYDSVKDSRENFRTSDYWEKRYQNDGNSGNGSYGRLASFKASTINDFISKKNIQSAVEFGVGDGHNLGFYNIEKYLGLDVSSRAIEICKSRYHDDGSKQFAEIDPLQDLSLNEKYDCALSIDVLYHLVEQDVYEMHLRNLFASAKKYVIIYAWDTEEQGSMSLSVHVKPRKFTKYISEKFNNWDLVGSIKQIYDDSSSDFFFYEKKSSPISSNQVSKIPDACSLSTFKRVQIDAYKNSGWGLSKLAFQKLFDIIIGNTNTTYKIIEFGSGISTQFLIDCALANPHKKIEILSFDNDPEYMFESNNSHSFFNILLRKLIECDDDQYERMFANQHYSRDLMHDKISPLTTRQRNNFYDIHSSDITGYYDLMILDGPNGNGRNIAFLHMIDHLKSGSYVLIDDFTHYDFIERFKSMYRVDEIFRREGGMMNQWENGGDFIIYKLI